MMIGTFPIGIAESEVDQSNGAIIINEQVLRLEVSMDDIESMNVLYSSNNLLKDGAGLVFWNPELKV
jgi:hypothetical protein